MQVGQIFRYARDMDPEPREIDGYPNFFHFTHLTGSTRVTMSRGINALATVDSKDEPRVPAIVLASSPHKTGSVETPWQDFFNADEGHVRYFGDAKNAGDDPGAVLGNSQLLNAKILFDAMDLRSRRLAPPIILFQRVRVGSAEKGYPAFQGYGVIERAQLIAQYDAKKKVSFPNYVFDIAVLDLSFERETFDWRWINDRRDPSLSTIETERCAPRSWKRWVQGGSQSLPLLKRRVTKLMTTPTFDQRVEAGSREEKALNLVYEFYEGKKHRFEILAARIVGRILEANGGSFRFGWVTPPSSDGGADFVGRLDLGTAFSRVKQVVFGQAKCEALTATTSGKDVARTAARLRRGWIGAYVTLGAFSTAVQREVIDDEYPILLVPGARVAEEIIAAATESGASDLSKFLEIVDQDYDASVIDRRPEDILRE